MAGRDRRDPEQARCGAAVDVGVHEMGVDEVRLLGAHSADDVARHPRADVEAAADGAVGDAEPVERLVEARCIGVGHVEPEKAGIDAALAQGRQQREQVPLRAADAGQLVEVEDLHGSSRR